MKKLMERIGAAVLSALLVAGCASSDQEVAAGPVSPDPYANETKEQRDQRMAWWREARFGMFIHWGVYAVPAGTYNGKQINGIGEWIMLRGEIPVSEYRAYAKEFNPVKYDPESWAELAKEAGMRYIVITSKHHDGFALFPSEVTDWDVADATPYGKDLIGPLAEAARDRGLKFGLYYSQAQDWTHPGGGKAGKFNKTGEGSGWDEVHKGDFDEYINGIAVPQVNEILSNYRPDVLWWDTPVWMNKERADRLIPLLRKVPGIIHNNRLGHYPGDTETPEQHIPATGYKDRDWEVCMTMNDTWGYKSYDDKWKSTEELIHKLCDIVSKGGNFLLNVGPTAEGLIPQPSIDRLQAVGKWMDVNSESIYGTTASPFHRLAWGRCTKKLNKKEATLYLHVFAWPDDGKLVVPGLKNMPSSIQLLDGGKKLQAEQIDGNLVIHVPAEAPDKYASVIRLKIKGDLDIELSMPKQAADGSIELAPVFADLHNRLGTQLVLKTGGIGAIGNWTDARAWAGWTFKVDRPGTFKVLAEVASPHTPSLTVGLAGGPKLTATVKPTGSYEKFETQELGEIKIAEPGVYQLEFRGVKKNWKPVDVRTVTLQPAES